MSVRIAVDVGGTFTDVVAVEAGAGTPVFVKVPTTHGRQAGGVLVGVERALAAGGWAGRQVVDFAHGTTVATNLVLEHKGAATALVTTGGFRDILTIGRQTRPDLYDPRARRPTPLVPRHLTFEIGERIGPRGEVLRPLDAGEVEALATALIRAGATSVAVVLLHSYRNPSHERTVRTVLERCAPTLDISLSSEVLPESGEYERASTTVMNAYVMPPMRAYLEQLSGGLDALGIRTRPDVMQSSGGLMTFETASRAKSVHTCLSGPAAGVLGATRFADLAGFRNVVAVDMGGTSFDVSLVLGGQVVRTSEGRVGEYPLRVPMFDIVTLGAGGGSLARVDDGGLLRVGPESAGAEPGPACYGNGGRRPTVTDANVVLGRLRDGRRLGGAITVDRRLAWAAVEAHIARPLGLSVPEAALGICRVVNATMVRGIRIKTVEQGHDPRDFALLAFGGSGPLHAVELAEELGIGTVIVPPTPGLCCAVGLLVAAFEHDFVASLQTRTDLLDEDRLAAVCEGLDEEARARVGVEQPGREATMVRDLSLDLRYVGQGHALTVPLGEGGLAGSQSTFHVEHRRLYGYGRPDQPVEAVSLRLRATVPATEAVTPIPPLATTDDPGRARLTETEVLVEGGSRAIPVIDRRALRAGERFDGPVVIEQDDATVFAGAHALRLDHVGNIVIELRRGQDAGPR